MASITQEKLEQIRSLLDAREQELVTDVKREQDQKSSHADVAATAPDPGDNAFADLTTDLENAAIDRDMLELKAIARARDRLDSGSYGTCIDCSEPIPLARLFAQPIAVRCARCQEIFEKSHPDAGRGASL